MTSRLDKRLLSERDICIKYITPALFEAGWDINTQFWEEVALTNGKVLVRGMKHKRCEHEAPYRIP